MIQRIARKMGKLDAEEGFTLIELMVVVLIIGILIAIAVPTFLGARTRAQNKAAESSLRNALTAAKTAFTDQDSYVTATATNLQSIEPSLTWSASGNVNTGTVSSNNISFAVETQNSTDDSIALAAMSASGSCFYMLDVSTQNSGSGHDPGTFYGQQNVGSGACTAADADAQATSSTAAGASW